MFMWRAGYRKQERTESRTGVATARHPEALKKKKKQYHS